MRSSVLADFVREEGGVNAAKHDERPSLARQASHVIPPKGIGRMDADADHVILADAVGVEWLERFVDDRWRPVTVGCRGREHVKPAGRDHSRTKRHVTRIDEMNAHAGPQKESAIRLPNRLKSWAVAMPPFLERSPSDMPAFAAAAQGVTPWTLGTGSDPAGGGASGDAASASGSTSLESVVGASVLIVAV